MKHLKILTTINTLILIINLAWFLTYKSNHYTINNFNIRVDSITKENVCVVENKIKKDITPINKKSKYFKDENDILLFAKYVKTQSNDVFTTDGFIDNLFVIQVLLNRLEDNKCNWLEYYNNPKINSSKTIRLMRAHKLIVRFNPETNRVDREILNNVNKAIYGGIDSQYIVPKNLMYFHSYKNKFLNIDKDIWNKYNYYTTVRHHFFLKK